MASTTIPQNLTFVNDSELLLPGESFQCGFPGAGSGERAEPLAVHEYDRPPPAGIFGPGPGVVVRAYPLRQIIRTAAIERAIGTLQDVGVEHARIIPQ